MASGSSLLLGACAPLSGADVGTAAHGATLRDSPTASMPGSHQLDMRDARSGIAWRVFVQEPQGPAPEGGFPVLYLLDANAAFFLAAQIARNLSNRPPGMRGDGLLVVGIGYPIDGTMDAQQRTRDYTPPPATEPGTGGADVLLDFIEQQLQPAVSAAWKTDPRRQTLFGHSFGGLFTLYALTTRTHLFTRYAAASPSLWWNNGRMTQSVDAFIARDDIPADRPVRLQLRHGALERMRQATSADPNRASKQAERRMGERAGALAERLAALDRPQLRVDYRELAGLDHGSVMAPALIDAITLAQREATAAM